MRNQCIRCRPVQAHGVTQRRFRVQSLRDESPEHPREDVAAPCRCQRRAAARIDVKAPVGIGQHAAGALQHDRCVELTRKRLGGCESIRLNVRRIRRE